MLNFVYMTQNIDEDLSNEDRKRQIASSYSNPKRGNCPKIRCLRFGSPCSEHGVGRSGGENE